MLQTIRRLLIRPGCFRLERELPGGVCTHDINAPWQGTQWNKIERRLFCHITQTWRATPLTSRLVVVDLIANTTTTKGLKVNAGLDEGYYPTGVKISKKELDRVPLTRHEFHGDWNYTVHTEATK